MRQVLRQLESDTLRNALILLYGKEGYITEFAKTTGRTRKTITRWLNGEQSIPPMVMLLVSLLVERKSK